MDIVQTAATGLGMCCRSVGRNVNCISCCAVFVVEVVAILEVDVSMTGECDNILVSFKKVLESLNIGVSINHSSSIVRCYLVVTCAIVFEGSMLIDENLVTIILILVKEILKPIKLCT